MARKVEREVLLGFVAEAKGYLPSIRDGLATLDQDAASVSALEEVHRHVHSIKGASAMVGVAGLSHIAYGLEEAIEDVAAGALALTAEVGILLRRLVDQIDAYLDGILSGTLVEASLVAEAQRTLRHLRCLPDVEASSTAHEAPSNEALGLGTVDFDQSVVESSAFALHSKAPVDEADNMAEPERVPARPLVESAWSPAADEALPDSLFGDILGSGMPFEEPPGFLDRSASSNEPEDVDVEPDQVSPELLEVFRLEAEDHLRTIHGALPALESEPENKELLQEIRRSAHTLKGAAAMVGFRPVTQLAHRMEDLLDQLYEGGRRMTPEILRMLFASTDALEDLSTGTPTSTPVSSLYAAFEDLLGGRGPVVEPVAIPSDEELDDRPVESAAIVDKPDAPALQSTSAPTQRQSGQYVRIPIERLDDLVKLVSELVIVRTQFEQRMATFNQLSGELNPSTERLRRASQKLETQYEVRNLASGHSVCPSSHANEGFTLVNRLLATYQTHGFDDLEFDRYTEFHLLSRELAETTNDIQAVAGEFSHLIGDFDGCLTRQGRLCREIEDKLRRLRMVPLTTLASRLHRTVRNVAQQQHKQVELVLEGENTELDKTVLEQLADPLLHLLRNAVDHGIESPADRQAKGKPAKGTIHLRAYNEGNQVIVQVSDDGAGVDVSRVRATAIERGTLTEEQAQERSPDELVDLLFQPGFSTAREISEISGRGVGLDIVKTQVQKLRGTLALDPRPELGAQFTIRLPMTLAIARALLVKTHQETFAVPLEAVRQIVRLEPGMEEKFGQKSVVRVNGQVYPLFHLGRLLNLKKPADDSVARPPLLILQSGAQTIAVIVDQLVGGREIVIKNLGSHLRRVPGVTGATLMGDGSAVLILNPTELISLGAVRAPAAAPSRPATPKRGAGDRQSLNVLIADDSPSVRRVVVNLLKRAEWNATTAKDGLDALEMLQRATVLPNVILLDIEMPRMDGYELLATLQANEVYKTIPVIFVTSRANDKHRKKAMDLGAAGYVIKPYHDDALLNLIRKLAVKSRQAVPV